MICVEAKLITRSTFRNAVRYVIGYPGADVHSDHNPLVAKLKIRLKTPDQSFFFFSKANYDVKQLKEPKK